ncbi:MAG: quinone-dependent dihydroorotate dehydrogenase [bacterium]|nr:quinone-dependent dihydroorotate dehydrogenase [bacterium]
MFIKLRNKIIGFLYRNILKKIFFRLDPEVVHDRMIKNGVMLGKSGFTRGLVGLMFRYKNIMLEQDILGISFKNPIGLSAGFDKNAELTDILPEVGFGFAELGSVTGEPCEGNPKPRLWRLAQQKSLVVYYGLKNDGAVAIAKKLQPKADQPRAKKDKKFKIPIGISIAKTNCQKTADLQEGVNDYVKAYRVLQGVGDYVTINISCPNAFGGQPFTDPTSLTALFTEIFKIQKIKPIFLKLSPDLSIPEVDALLAVCCGFPIDGYICSNLTKNRNRSDLADVQVPEHGGLSGKLVSNLSNNHIAHIYKKTGGRKVIIGCGGVFDATDAYKKIKNGASLIQMITGMIFEGPQVISEINQGLVELLESDGYSNISDAIGANSQTESL